MKEKGEFMKQLADYVNPYIGTISHMLKSTKPEVMLPYSSTRSSTLVDECEDYFCNQHIIGYPIGRTAVMPGDENGFENTLDHSREWFKCYHMKMELEEKDIIAETTVTEHCYLHRFTNATRLKLSAKGKFEFKDGLFLITVPIDEEFAKGTEYAAVKIVGDYKTESENENELILSCGNTVTVIGAVSFISLDKAIYSLKTETAAKDFDKITSLAKEIWNKQLGKIKIEGNSDDRKTVFYTALYRAFQRMTDYTEYGQYFSGYDGKVHDGCFYTGDGLWDTFRCMHPLQLILDSKRHKDILESYNLMYKQSGLMPSFPGFGGDLPVMIGFHAASIFADAKAKGVDVDYETAYEGIRKNALEQTMFPWRCGIEAQSADKCYYEKGFFPALKKGEAESCKAAHPFENRQSVAVTLEHAYDDWCVAELARALGKEDDYKLFSKRADNYKNLYNPQLGFMAPKSDDGEWVEDFNPKWSGGMGGREYTTENNSWTYTWSVFHDPEGLAALMGGRDEAAKRLDSLFCEGFSQSEGSKFVYLGQFPDSTGLMGQFSMGNEPSFHIPYLYDYFGFPWKAQKILRDLMDIWFINSPIGICGDEDGGAMSSWLVFSAVGFYPVCPGKAEYAIGTPLFDKAELQLDGGKSFTVISSGAGDGKRYIKSATLNGKPLDRPFITHEQLMAGGELTLEMDSRPNK